MGPVLENTDVKFDRLITNVGGAYDEASGKFVAPIDGVYQFNVVISAQGRQKVISSADLIYVNILQSTCLAQASVLSTLFM